MEIKNSHCIFLYRYYNEGEISKKPVSVMSIQYLILIPMVLLAVAKVLLQGMISRTYLKNTTDSAIYNMLVFGGMSVLYFIVGGFKLPSLHILPYGILYGLMLAGFQICYTLALKCGPVSHTALIVTFSLAFAVTFGIIYCGEQLTILHISGLACIFLSLLLTIDFKQTKQHKFNIIWFLLSLAAMTMNGTASIIVKLQKMTYPDEDMGMLLTTYVSGTLLLYFIKCCYTGIKKQPRAMVLSPSRLFIMLSCSVLLGSYLFLFSIGAGTIPAVVFFPIVNIAPTTVISLFGIFIFKDKLTRQQVFSLIFGIAATLLLCL